MVWPTAYDDKLDEYDAMELPGQQLRSAQALCALDHILNLDIKSAPAVQRLTGIIVTMGKSTNDVDVMMKLIAAGMNIALLNMNFGTKDDHIETIKMLRQAVKKYSIEMGRAYPLAIAARLAGKKIRTGRIADTYGEFVELRTGDVVKLTTDETYKERCSMYVVYIDFMYFAEQMKKGNNVLLDNETISLQVEIISTSTVTCKIERGGLLGSYKDVFVPHVTLDMPNFSEKDKGDIEMLVQFEIDILVASFVSNAEILSELRSHLGEKGKRMAIIANIQTLEGYDNFDSIMQNCTGVMITRQELGSDITPKKLVIAQKNMLARANKANVPCSICAHILSSMQTKKMPLRSELLDISNCIIDGADSIVLSAETAIGMYPVETVLALSNTCKEAEACLWTRQIFRDFLDKTAIPVDQSVGVCIGGVLAANRLLAAAIIVITSTGNSAKILSKFKPRCPIIAVTRYPQIARQLHLWRGIMPVIYEEPPDPLWTIDLERRFNFSAKWAIERGFVRIGDPIVLISGWRQGSGYTNTMRIVYASEDLSV